VSTPNILARKSDEGPLLLYETREEMDGNNGTSPLVRAPVVTRFCQQLFMALALVEKVVVKQNFCLTGELSLHLLDPGHGTLCKVQHLLRRKLNYKKHQSC
jgi:hypothetical protein